MRPVCWMVLLSMTTQVPAVYGATSDAMDACAAQSDDASRLACFDKELARRRNAAVKSPAPAPEPALPTAAPETKGATQASSEPAPVPRPVPPAKAYTAKVASASEWAHFYTVTLEGGQVWKQTETVTGFVLKPGEAVTIKPGIMGGSWLIVDSHHRIRVEQIH
jgi:hypothetical protein